VQDSACCACCAMPPMSAKKQPQWGQKAAATGALHAAICVSGPALPSPPLLTQAPRLSSGGGETGRAVSPCADCVGAAAAPVCLMNMLRTLQALVPQCGWTGGKPPLPPLSPAVAAAGSAGAPLNRSGVLPALRRLRGRRDAAGSCSQSASSAELLSRATTKSAHASTMLPNAQGRPAAHD
jgi:hypothetical protein